MNYLTRNKEENLLVAKQLNQLLADYHVYYQKLRNFHWNIVGENFFELHEKFEEMYTDARGKIDEIAERILTLQFHPVSRYSRYLKISSISENSPFQTDRDMIMILLEDHKKLLYQMNVVINKAEKVHDEGTIDLIGGYIKDLEKTSWMLNAWTKSKVSQLKADIVLS
ncbi:Dps family protein [uncultured Tenacibaculum sp.]|uniref:Dps family protein n=1 Tax=uncultured Tenacibaculum sp. TaxID=174713 RepID=UPI002602F8AC|nr:DNA starvation/stationary phase protection protein [uncultured Tenacibaculum sp.]